MMTFPTPVYPEPPLRPNKQRTESTQSAPTVSLIVGKTETSSTGLPNVVAPPGLEPIDLSKARSVQTRYEQEGDDEVKDVLGDLISEVEKLSSRLTEAYKAQAETETQLVLARSNLQMALANNEMLEDALKTSGATRDVGWTRAATPRLADERQRTVSVDGLPPSPQTTPSSPSGSRLSKMRPNHNRIASASLPILVSPREVELEAKLETAKAAHADLQAELESLSQALFEEANKMVAAERIKRAETEEELAHVTQEREALKGALLIIESENQGLRSRTPMGHSVEASIPPRTTITPPQTAPPKGLDVSPEPDAVSPPKTAVPLSSLPLKEEERQVPTTQTTTPELQLKIERPNPLASPFASEESPWKDVPSAGG